MRTKLNTMTAMRARSRSWAMVGLGSSSSSSSLPLSVLSFFFSGMMLVRSCLASSAVSTGVLVTIRKRGVTPVKSRT